MSSVKEPYIISVWEEELIPAQDWYVKGDVITEDQYNLLESDEKKNYRSHSTLNGHYIKEESRITSEEYNEIINDFIKANEGLTEEKLLEEIQNIAKNYERYTVMEHFEEVQGVIIGSDSMDSIFSASNPVFKETVNGSVELTFGLYYKVFDPDSLEFSSNPYVSMLTNEAKIKFKFRDKWYDLIVKNCVEDSANYLFTYTCKDFYINELNKNGFKVELDSELENNQGTITKLGKTILKDTDWQIDEEKSDIIVETKIEPLYIGIPKYDLKIEKVNNYIPDINVETDNYPDTWVIEKKHDFPILLFYSDITERKEEPQILAVFEPDPAIEGSYIYLNPAEKDDENKYLLDVNDDVITNGCNYRIVGYKKDGSFHKVQYGESALKDNIINIIDSRGLNIYERARAEKVVRSRKTSYDPDMDMYVSKYHKLIEVEDETTKTISIVPDTEVEYYGYEKEDILRTDLVENYLANSDDFTSTETGWIFDGIPEKRSKAKEAGYVGQIFQKTTINSKLPNSAVGYDESILELNLKSEKDERYYKDTQGDFYLIKGLNENNVFTEEFISAQQNPDYINAYKESVFDLYKKYQNEGVQGYAEKTDSELNAMVNEYLSSIRYSCGQRVAINTGVGANRNKIKQLSPGEEYVFTVSLGKYKDGEVAPKIGDKIVYGVKAPDAYYDFIEVDNSGELAYNAAEEAIDEYSTEFKSNKIRSYLQNPQYQGVYQEKYNETYNLLKNKYKERYLRTSSISNDTTKENWQPGGRRLDGLHGLWGTWIGYYEIFLNVLRGFKPEDSEEDCCDPNFLNSLHEALQKIKTDTSGEQISKRVYKAFISGTSTGSDGNLRYEGLYPEMVRTTIKHSLQKRKDELPSKRAAYDVMGVDRELYPEYIELSNSLSPIIDSFNEFLFSQFYYGVLNKWLGSVEGSPVWTYTNKDELSSLLKSIYKACYENTNTIFEVWDYTKEYHMPTLTNQSGGKYYQIHEADWVQKSKAAAEEQVRIEEATKGKFQPPFKYEEEIPKDDEEKKEEERTKRNKFIKLFSGGYIKKEGENEVFDKEDNNLADYCYKKEQSWLSTKTETQIQSGELTSQLKVLREGWIEEYIKKQTELEIATAADFGGVWYCANLLGKYYTQITYEKEVGTYTYNTDTFDLNITDAPTAPGKLVTYIPLDIETKLSELAIKHSNGEISDEEYQEQYAKLSELKQSSKINWEETTLYTSTSNATHYALLDEKETEEEKVGGYVFDRITKQIRLFDPYQDVLNATFIPQKDDEGAYVFDPFTGRYRPFRDWDSSEFRDPLTFEINNNAGVPGDKVYHPLKLFDGKLGAWYDTPTRYNMIRKYENPEDAKYKYLTEDVTIIETGHYEGQEYEYKNTYPKGYQYDVYVPTKRGKYVEVSEVGQKNRSLNLFKNDIFGIEFSLGESNFPQIIKEGVQGFFDRLIDGFNKIFPNPNQNSDLNEINEAYIHTNDEDANKGGAGIAISNINDQNVRQTSNKYYDEDRISINEYNKVIGSPVLDEIANTSEFSSAIKSGQVKPINTRSTSSENNPPITKQYIKYKPYYWRHWGKPRYDYQPKICIQQTVDGIKTYKPYNNIEDKKPEAYTVHPLKNLNEISDKDSSKIIFLKNRRTTYRQRTETDYETYKYRMEKVKDMSKNYWIEAPNGENYLRRYKFGDGEIKLFDGHIGKWVQCYSDLKVLSNEELPSEERDQFLPDFYIPYDNIMIPYNKRIFNATKRLTRVPKKYSGNQKDNDNIYVKHGDIYVTLTQYLSEVGYSANLSYDNLKISFIDDYEYRNDYFAISLPETRNKYLEFDLGVKCKYIDLTVETDPFTSEVTKERWAYWVSAVTKGFSLIENPLSKLGMLFETVNTNNYDQNEETKNNTEGRYVFLGMQLFKHIPYEASSEKVTYKTLSENEQLKDLLRAFEEIYEDWNNSSDDITSSYEQWKDDYEFDDNWSNLNQEAKEALIEILKQKISQSPDSIAFLNSASSMYENNKTILESSEGVLGLGLEVKTITSSKKTENLLFPGEAPDAADLHFTTYYIYDPDITDHPDNAIYEYVGRDYSEKFVLIYDEDCQKIRSIKGKESNYFKLLEDCCDTFDCWMQKEVEHNPVNGQVIYDDIPIYTEILQTIEEDIEPQVFVGSEAKFEGTYGAAKRLHHKLFKKIMIQSDEEEPEVEGLETGEDEEEQIQEIPDSWKFKENCTYVAIEEDSLDEKEQKMLLRLNRLNNLQFKIEYMRVPQKRIVFKRYVGEEKWNGFKYGVNLNHIKRTIDSSQFSTRVIVKQNNNEFGKDKFCTIARAEENPIKENFILDFSYYVNNKLLDNSDLIGDLYTDTNTRLNYYPKLANLNRRRNELITRETSLLTSLDNITAKYETAVQLRDAALEEITKLTQLLTSNYDTYGQVISIPWEYNKSQEYVQKRQNSAPGSTKIISDQYGGVDYSFEVAIPKTTTVVEYPKYNDTMRNYLDQMDVHQKEYAKSIELLSQLEPEKKRLEAEIAEIEAYLEEIANKKNELNKLFYHKYSRFIQEGSWVDENYIDDNLYYLDALSVSRISAKPKITYDIGVVDVSVAYEYEEDKIVLESNLGDRTYIEDTEFFGYNKNDYTKPYWEMVVVTEKIYHIGDPSKNQIKVKNYTTQFDDLFQRIAATSQTLQFNEGSYGRAASLLNENGTLKSEVLKESIANSDFIIMNAVNEDVKIDKTGVTITSTMNRANVVKLVSSGILVSSDGGNHYSTAITGDGINADLLLSGTINTDRLLIGGRSNPNFLWNRLGISSFKTDNDKIDYSSFVRMDQYGIYGIKNYSKDGREPQSMSINDAFEPLNLKDITENPNAVFGLTWEGFFLNAANGTGKVTIGTGQDFKMSEYSDDQNRWIDRVVIGRLNNNDYYGFQLKNSDGQVVMETGDTGELYLKRKLRISNFGEEATAKDCEWVYEGNLIQVDEELVKENDLNSESGLVTNQDEEGKTTRYFKNYFYQYVTDNNNKVIKYYTIENTILFAIVETIIGVEELVKKPSDRVTLGIVDTYKRVDSENIPYLKQEVKGTFDSVDYLTKIFSVKSNSVLPLEIFSSDSISYLIETNENFAIFDNGNLFAKNAWIEGNIDATSGILRNLKVYGTLEIGQEETYNDIVNIGTLKHANDKWEIRGDGSAYFKDVIISGTISAATFEYNKIQTVSGSLLVAPGIVVKETVITEKGDNQIEAKFYLDSLPVELIQQAPDKRTSTQKVPRVSLFKESAISYDKKTNNQYGLNEYTVVSFGTETEGQYEGLSYIVIQDNNGNKIDIEQTAMIVFLGFLDENDNSETRKMGIVINALSQHSIYPKESISIIDICQPDKPATLFGLFSDNIFTDAEKETLAKDMVGQYGLYSDNVYVKGTIASQTEGYIAGITTKDIIEKNSLLTNETEYVVFFAGTALDDLKFSVTKQGNLYAKDGYFENGVFQGVIRASKIIGNGGKDDNYGLEIIGSKLNNALRFISSEEEDMIEYFSLETNGCYFYTNDYKTLFSVLYEENNRGIGMFSSSEGSKNQRTEYKLNFREALNDQIEMSFKGVPVATIDATGFRSLSENGLGDNCQCIPVQSKGATIGVNFILKGV